VRFVVNDGEVDEADVAATWESLMGVDIVTKIR